MFTLNVTINMFN